ncbi:hypothetical protein PO124_07365 [Bacillus licheniformis]|nr:hypothetical protein [Bacillus licheniformis]
MEAVGVGVLILWLIFGAECHGICPGQLCGACSGNQHLIGTVMGAVLLSEGFGRLRIIAAALMVLGVISVAAG